MENNKKTDKLEMMEDEIKYPKSVFFIITNEFCERFCYYGMKTVLYLYMLKKLHYEENNATVLYFCP
ncbi:hypothetical protein M8J76_016038 [Diaphorina citri]|nr:hypothetical protein M8J76_016038 [Diaphorina citri]